MSPSSPFAALTADPAEPKAGVSFNPDDAIDAGVDLLTSLGLFQLAIDRGDDRVLFRSWLHTDLIDCIASACSNAKRRVSVALGIAFFLRVGLGRIYRLPEVKRIMAAQLTLVKVHAAREIRWTNNWPFALTCSLGAYKRPAPRIEPGFLGEFDIIAKGLGLSHQMFAQICIIVALIDVPSIQASIAFELQEQVLIFLDLLAGRADYAESLVKRVEHGGGSRVLLNWAEIVDRPEIDPITGEWAKTGS